MWVKITEKLGSKIVQTNFLQKATFKSGIPVKIASPVQSNEFAQEILEVHQQNGSHGPSKFKRVLEKLI